MNDRITQKWKDETILQAKALADRAWKGKLGRLMDDYQEGYRMGDPQMFKEAEENVINLIESLREQSALKGGIEQALAERQRILGILDDYNLGGQLDGMIELINNV